MSIGVFPQIPASYGLSSSVIEPGGRGLAGRQGAGQKTRVLWGDWPGVRCHQRS